jgi:hypothetical protein
MRNIVAIAGFLLSASLVAGAPKLVYVKKDNRERTILASLEASGLPTLRGTWYYIGPFDNQTPSIRRKSKSILPRPTPARTRRR